MKTYAYFVCREMSLDLCTILAALYDDSLGMVFRIIVAESVARH